MHTDGMIIFSSHIIYFFKKFQSQFMRERYNFTLLSFE
jgi:hypothetical protein